MTAPPIVDFAAAWITDVSGNVLLDMTNSIDLPYAVTTLDPGMPAVRAVTNDAPGRYGALNTTRYFSARAVTASFGADDGAKRTLMRALAMLADPSQRFYLVVQIPEWGPGQWRMLLVPDQFSMPLTYDGSDITAGWQAPNGVWESAVQLSRLIFPGGATSEGLVFAATMPWSFGVGTPAGVSLVNSAGTVATPPVINIYGPVTAPSLTNETTGETIKFTSSYVVPAGQYVSIDCESGTVLANGDPTLTRMSSVDWTTSDFWQLMPGNNQIAFTGSSISTVTQAEILWRERSI